MYSTHRSPRRGYQPHGAHDPAPRDFPTPDDEEPIYLSPSDARALLSEINDLLRPLEEFAATVDEVTTPLEFLQLPTHLEELQDLITRFELFVTVLPANLFQPAMLRMLQLRDSLSALESRGPWVEAACDFEWKEDGRRRLKVSRVLLEY